MKNYVIIGGSSGIGRDLVQLLGQDEVKVFASYHRHQMEDSQNVKYFALDVRNDSLNTEDLPEEVHGLVYCPGSINLKPFHRFSEEDFLEDYKLNVLGATRIIQQLLPQLKAAGQASIVLFSTVAVQQGFNFHSQVAMSKGAIEGLCRALSAELAPRIRVNAVAPSLTDTPLAERLLSTEDKKQRQAELNPLKRVGQPRDIAAAARFLLGEESSWITGQIIHVDGGFSSIKL